MDIRGKIGQVIYCKRKSGSHYVKAAPQVVRNPNSPAQSVARNSFDELSGMFRRLSDQERTSWGIAAEKGVKRGNPEGGTRALIKTPKGTPTGKNTFVGTNRLAQSIGQTEIISKAKISVPPPNGSMNLTASYSDGKIIVRWDNIKDTAESHSVRVWLDCSGEGFHKQLAVSVPAAEGYVDINEVKGAKGKTKSLSTFPGKTVLIQADVVDRSKGIAFHPSRTLDVEIGVQ